MNRESEYITPNLLLESSYKDLLKQYSDFGPMIAWTREEKQIELIDLLRQNCVFVVGDQTTPNMIQELKRLLIRNPLISIEI